MGRHVLVWVGLLSALFLQVSPVHAQLLSKWGHPVITLGQTPYEAVSTGHGHYPGSNGFIPGYGYYPGDLPGHYPWLDGPDGHHAAAPVLPPGTGDSAWPPGPGPAAPPATGEPPAALVDVVATRVAALLVHVPADAELWVFDHKTTQRGVWRLLVSPPLENGRPFIYELRASWREGGQEVERLRTIPVSAGDRLTIDLTLPEPPNPGTPDPSRP